VEVPCLRVGLAYQRQTMPEMQQGGLMRYSLIYADPAWSYNQRATHKKTKFGGGVHGNYPVMKPGDIARLPIGELAADNCALLMWATFPNLQEALDVMKAWGFRYTTVAFTWIKTNKKSGRPFFGPGYYTGANAEIVLLGIKGKMKPVNNDVPQALICPHPRDPLTRKIIHSRKPDEIRDRIVRLFGDLPRVELFAREISPGWVSIGNQLADNPVELLPAA
jgi:N6-adenosine-specific RNA methylase IME4